MEKNCYLKTISFYLLLFTFFIPNLYSQKNISDCNRAVNFNEYLLLLPNDFCMPKGFTVIDIHSEDVNGDGKEDRLIEFSKKEWKCGDTTFLAIYFGEENSNFKYIKTLSNLYVPIVERFDSEWLIKNCPIPDSISRYDWPNQGMVKFKKGQIIVPFAVDYSKGLDFYFEYDKERENWYLQYKQEWYRKDFNHSTEIEYWPENKVEKVNNGLCIDDFKIKNYLIPW